MSKSGNSQVDSPLKKKGGTLAIGYGSSATQPRAYGLNDGEDFDVGFLKMFFTTQPVDLSDIPQRSPFIGGRADVARKKAPPQKWGTRLIPVIQKRMNSSEEENNTMSR